jgi:hypothetical protein
METEKEPSKFATFKPYVLQLFMLIVGAVVGFISSLAFFHFQNETRVLEFATHSSRGLLNNIQKANDNTDSIRVTFKNRTIENISEFSIYIANLTDTDVGPLPVFIEIYSDKPIKILSSRYFDQNVSKEGIQVTDTLKPLHKGGHRFAYNVQTLNKSEDFARSIGFTYLLEGDVVPQYSVHVNKPGIDVKEFNIKDHKDFWHSINWKFFGSQALIIVGMMFLLSVYYEKTAEKKLRYAIREARRKANTAYRNERLTQVLGDDEKKGV